LLLHSSGRVASPALAVVPDGLTRLFRNASRRIASDANFISTATASGPEHALNGAPA
jgi:hypothetical protein